MQAKLPQIIQLFKLLSENMQKTLNKIQRPVSIPQSHSFIVKGKQQSNDITQKIGLISRQLKIIAQETPSQCIKPLNQPILRIKNLKIHAEYSSTKLKVQKVNLSNLVRKRTLKMPVKVNQSLKVVIIRLLNYSIDFNLKICFLQSLKKLAEFYFIISKYSEAQFYYNQTRQCAILFDEPLFLIESIIGLARCCSKKLLHNEAFIILKKGLQYTWLYNLPQYELSIYDLIGKQLYLMGETNKAAKYHGRYIKAILEKDDSPLKILSIQRLKKTEEINIQKRYSQINMLFLVHLSVPIKKTDEIPLLQEIIGTPLRDQYDINKTYFSHYREFCFETKKILTNWFFREEIEQPSLPQETWTKQTKSKKFAHVDFQLNQKLKMMGIKPNESVLKSRQDGVKYKESLQEKIARKIKELPLEKDWYEKMVKQIKRDHKNKLLQVRSMIRVRGKNKLTKPSMSQTRKIYSSFSEDYHF